MRGSIIKTLRMRWAHLRRSAALRAELRTDSSARPMFPKHQTEAEKPLSGSTPMKVRMLLFCQLITVANGLMALLWRALTLRQAVVPVLAGAAPAADLGVGVDAADIEAGNILGLPGILPAVKEESRGLAQKAMFA